MRYFRHRTLGTWYAGTRATTAPSFTDDGRADAEQIAAACGFAAGDVEPIALADGDPDPRSGMFFAEPATPPIPLDADGQRIYDYMPVSGSAAAQTVSAYLADTTKDPAIRATMATLRSLIRKQWQERKT